MAKSLYDGELGGARLTAIKSNLPKQGVLFWLIWIVELIIGDYAAWLVGWDPKHICLHLIAPNTVCYN